MEKYISFDGNGAEFDGFLRNYFADRDIKTVHEHLSVLKDSLDATEEFKISRGFPGLENGQMGLMIFGNNYHLNVRLTSIALLGLLLDINFTKGFTVFAMQVFGINTGVIRKLETEEKEFLMLVNAGMIARLQGHDEYIILNEDRKGYDAEKIKKLVDSLTEKKIVHDVNGVLKICF